MKKKLLIVIVLSSLFLTACGDKNTITFDAKTNQVTINLDEEKKANTRSIVYLDDFMYEIYENCVDNYEQFDRLKAESLKKGTLDTGYCGNGIKYIVKNINEN